MRGISSEWGSEAIERVPTRRDWLRENPGDRELYAQAKQELAQRQWKHVQNYADAKSEMNEAILSRAHAASGRVERGPV